MAPKKGGKRTAGMSGDNACASCHDCTLFLSCVTSRKGKKVNLLTASKTVTGTKL